MGKPQGDWRKLIAFSSKWHELADGVFSRVSSRIDSEKDPELKLKLRRFLRGLRSAHDDVTRSRDLLAAFEVANAADVDAAASGTQAPGELEAAVAGRRAGVTGAFFDYVKWRIASAGSDEARRDELVALASRVAALADATDRASADEDAMQSAASKMHDLLQADSMEDADSRIDALAASGQLDPAFLLTMARAWSGVRETDYTRDDVKEVMHRLWLRAKEAAARDAPREVRILKALLAIDDPSHRRAEMAAAFKEGAELSTADADYLHTQPRALLLTVQTVLEAYKTQRGSGTMLGQAAGIMDPRVVMRLRDIEADIRKEYL